MANVNLTFVNIYSSKIKYITLASNYRKTLTRNTQFYLFGLNEHRYAVVEKAYGPKKNSKNPFERLRGIDGCNIPPCQREFKQHINKSGFVAKMWATADHQDIVQNPKTTDGWELKDGCFEPVMFEGPQIPDELLADDVNVTNADKK